MAFSSSITGRENLGSVTLMYGTYTNGAADSGGTITTGFGTVMGFGTASTGSVDETIPKYSVSAGVVTLVTANDSDGNWFAVGK